MISYAESMIARTKEAAAHLNNRDAQRLELRRCALDPVYWCNRWCMTLDPRNAGVGEPTVLPFDLFPKQVEFMRWLEERDRLQQGGIVEKSREVGLTWLCCAFAVHRFLSRAGDSTGFGSRKFDFVDQLGNPDSIFEKIRFLLYHLPCWMLPGGFDERTHDKQANIVNPANGSSITGEGGDDIGRGGRKTRYFVDEAAHLERPQRADSSLSENTRVRIDVSTPNGPGNPFAAKRFSGKLPVFTLHWKDDPRKNATRTQPDGKVIYPWYESRKEALIDPVVIASQLDIDYSASIEGIAIPAAWVRCAVEFALPPGQCVVAGLDVGEMGPDLSVIIGRAGPVALPPESWGRTNTTETAWRARDIAARLKASEVCYDAGGPGAGVRGVWDTAEHLPFSPTAVQFGGSPTDAWWPDGQTSKEKFLNLRAEMWWKLRARFERTYEFREKGVAHAVADMISLPNHPQLIAELSLPLAERTEGGKIKLESKDRMRARGVKSPNFADALALAFHAEVSGLPKAGKDDTVKDPPADVWQTRPRRHDDPGEDGPGRVGGRAGQASAGGIEQLWPEAW